MNKVAFITGAGGFLGSEIARTLAKNGIAIAVCVVNEEAVKSTVKYIEALGGKAYGRVLDVSNSQDVDKAVSETVEKFGRLDIMVSLLQMWKSGWCAAYQPGCEAPKEKTLSGRRTVSTCPVILACLPGSSEAERSCPETLGFK